MAQVGRVCPEETHGPDSACGRGVISQDQLVKVLYFTKTEKQQNVLGVVIL